MKNTKEKIKVCIVEDDPATQEMYRLKLEEDGFEVFTANDGEEGYKLMKKEIPNIALIDILMPKVDGISLMRKMQQDNDLLKIPIIVTSNVDEEKTFREAGEFNVKFYLVKSRFTPKDVVGIVREVLESKR